MALENTYNRIAKYYDLLDFPFEILIYSRMRYDALHRIRDGEILEIGLGTGKNLPHYHKSNSIDAIEPSKNMRKYAHTKIENTEANVDIIQNSIQNFSTDKRYTHIIASFVLYLLDDIERVIEKMRGLLKPGGKIIVLEYNGATTPVQNKLLSKLSKITNTLYGLDFTSIRTKKLLNDKFELVEYKEYGYGWLFSGIWQNN